MRREEALAILSRHRSDVDSHDVRRLALFGSVARDEARPDSDVDVFVEFAGTPTFAHFMDLKLLLEDILGHPVDLATEKALKPDMRSAVEAEMVDVRQQTETAARDRTITQRKRASTGSIDRGR